MKKKFAILASEDKHRHSSSWATPWIEYCENQGIEYNVLNPYSISIIDDLRSFDVLLWNFGGYSFQDMLIAKSIIFSAKRLGLQVFPDFNESWHFDDKLAENYLLNSVNAPQPKFYHFFSFNSLKQWVKKLEYPIVAKLKNGSGSNNVKLIKNESQALAYGKRMFSKGYNSAPSLFFKAASNIKSSHSFKTFIGRASRIPEFLRTLKSAKEFQKERGYVLLQEFIPNDGYDIKVVVIKDKLSFIVRKSRKGDFRASGGGDLLFDNNYITMELINAAFKTSDDLGFVCMGYDFVIDNRNRLPKIIEISYSFSHKALLEAGGYFDRNGIWHDTPLNAPHEIIKYIIG